MSYRISSIIRRGFPFQNQSQTVNMDEHFGIVVKGKPLSMQNFVRLSWIFEFILEWGKHRFIGE